MYGRDEIQTVYKQFSINPHSVVYSIDNGLSWQSPEMDTGKWGSGLEPAIRNGMKFAFLEMKTSLHVKKSKNDRVWDEKLKDWV